MGESMSEDDVEYIERESDDVPHFYDVAAQRAQALQFLLTACAHMQDERAVELAYAMADVLIRSIDIKAVRVVK
jgi:hypothetical protein